MAGPMTLEEAQQQGFKDISDDEAMRLLTRISRSRNFDAKIAVGNPCEGKSDKTPCQDPVDVGGSILVGYCFGSKCKYMKK